ncbi:HypC/HybG/HupF family hydrogenase formation chaperone [Phaeobacter gallaeciensis]|uniref:HypC/HybG/HupF family hydrogenase formation chaperone n=1 Tax=Phaeobacter gallaeciensis TaxID=60890 RepID=UPI00237EEE0A|nr:HypC/HybG/HupF family hydrogenase formation chaperone [Phaeobacter gallaeciensis]MDE4100001.1 HypC/HybG/HupF family hydrogenase formation chaperone [Phaeobacter gallaeciensis]MDE4108807.1 HypC/HybG/HupF family hydrogenase formation chaperone [Phaeobacter gallaeciensis]MDE4113253.1 HypC/HybG/HupF family hydrogenase formation chaperone [Phaeobacter gallaeciensis]MDE4117694.1 HypC/HybG/HupF family hydrogenase formation chaperone [Phaeobacter gallaeciensis]MDE4122197.1 HypC/HybG/HupF family hyd
MCVGIPMQITAIDGIAATVRDGDRTQVIDLSLTPGATVGDWVLTFLGSAREVISTDEARKISAALDGLRAVMRGGDAGDAFDDIVERGPQLPAHLQAALDAGRTTG